MASSERDARRATQTNDTGFKPDSSNAYASSARVLDRYLDDDGASTPGASDGLPPMVHIYVPQRIVDEWRRAGLTEVRPDLARIITLVRDAYEAAVQAARARKEFDRLARTGRVVDAWDRWDSLRESIDNLPRLAEAELVVSAADPVLTERVGKFEAALERGKRRIDDAVEAFESAQDPVSAETKALLDDLGTALRVLQEQSRGVGQACHDASTELAKTLGRVLDQIMMLVPSSPPEGEDRALKRQLSDMAKTPPAMESAPTEKTDRSLAGRTGGDAVDVPNPIWKER